MAQLSSAPRCAPLTAAGGLAPKRQTTFIGHPEGWSRPELREACRAWHRRNKKRGRSPALQSNPRSAKDSTVSPATMK